MGGNKIFANSDNIGLKFLTIDVNFDVDSIKNFLAKLCLI